MSRRRVVVTGMGALSAAGAGVEAFWRACVDARAALQPDFHDRFGASQQSPVGMFTGTLPRDQEKASALALAASAEALKSARLEPARLPSLGIALGSCLGGALDAFAWLDELRGDDDAVRVPFPASGGVASPAFDLAAEYDVKGPVISISSACSSSLGAIAQAAACIRRGEADRMLAGGVDALTPFVVAGFRAMGALTSTRVRPFDRRRDGLALGEGAGMLVLEERSQASDRGAPIRAELLGFGSASDAQSGNPPAQAANGLVRAMAAAFKDAGRGPESVDFVSAQGTGTRHGDHVELLAIKSTFGNESKRIAVNSSKPIVGHTLGAAAALSAILCVKVLEHGLIPPMLNHEEADSDCDLGCVGDRARRSPVHCTLVLASGFASHNAALLLGRP